MISLIKQKWTITFTKIRSQKTSRFSYNILLFLKNKDPHMQGLRFSGTHRSIFNLKIVIYNQVFRFFSGFTKEKSELKFRLHFFSFGVPRQIASLRSDLKTLEKIVNIELKRVKIWCDVNRLSMNFSKTNFMIIKSPKKKR